jgi:hypothetical protein
MTTRTTIVCTAVWLLTGIANQAHGQDARTADRGPGVASSMFGTYIARGELLIYPFFEYYRDHDFEYKPEELGFVGDADVRGRYRAHEGLFFLGYGLSDDLAVEVEAAAITARLDKSPADRSAMPPRIQESGLGDVEAQLRWRWRRETEERPELFSYGEVVFPHARDKALIGTPGWELKLGTGLVRGTAWGTWTARAAVEYSTASSSRFDIGEYAVEYLKRLSPSWRVYAGVEGTQDEVSLLGELQWHVSRYAFIRFNSGVGLTSKATDWTPELGIVFRIPTR